METWKKYISAIVFICGFAVLPSYAFSAAALQEHGVVLTGEAKQDYIQKEMNALYHPLGCVHGFAGVFLEGW